MPIYEYECRSCGVHFERKQSVTDDPVEFCPECGGRVRKLFFPVGIIFKGSGFYKTDYAGASPKSSEPASSTASESKEKPKSAEPAKAEPAKSATESSKAETKAP